MTFPVVLLALELSSWELLALDVGGFTCAFAPLEAGSAFGWGRETGAFHSWTTPHLLLLVGGVPTGPAHPLHSPPTAAVLDWAKYMSTPNQDNEGIPVANYQRHFGHLITTGGTETWRPQNTELFVKM